MKQKLSKEEKEIEKRDKKIFLDLVRRARRKLALIKVEILSSNQNQLFN